MPSTPPAWPRPYPRTGRAPHARRLRGVKTHPTTRHLLRVIGDCMSRHRHQEFWHDGTSHLLFESLEFLEKLAAITPRPAVNLVLYHGVLAPHARWRAHGARYARPAPDVNAREREASPRAAGTAGAGTWAALMPRVFDLDVLACPRRLAAGAASARSPRHRPAAPRARPRRDCPGPPASGRPAPRRTSPGSPGWK